MTLDTRTPTVGRIGRIAQYAKDKPLQLVSLVLLVGITFVVLYPLIGVLWRTYGPGGPGFPSDVFSQRLLDVLADTATVVVGSTALAVIIGVILAWIHERTDANLGWVGELLPLSTMIVPAIAGVVGWVILFDPRIGYGNAFLRWITGSDAVEGPINIYSVEMLIVVSAVYLVPYVFLFMTSALQVLDSSMEEAAKVSGASGWRTLTRVVFPAVLPSLAASIIIAMIRSLMTFLIVAVIGTRAGIETIPVYIFRLMGEFPSNTSMAVLMAFGLMVLVQLLLMAQSKITKAGRFASVGGKGSRVRRTNLGFMRPVTKIIMGAYLIITSILPMVAVLLVSIQPAWTATVDLSKFTLDSYTRLFTGFSSSVDAIRNSIVLAVAAATIVMIVAVIILVMQRQTGGRLGGFASGIMTVPAVVPHSLVGVAFIVSFAPAPFSLYGTVTILLLAYIVMELPYAAQATKSVLDSVSKELPEAARVFGAGQFRTFGRVLIPLMLPGIAAGWIIVVIHVISEATASVMLAGINNPVVGQQLLGLVADGTYGQVSALATVVAFFTTVLVVGMLIVRRRATRFM